MTSPRCRPMVLLLLALFLCLRARADEEPFREKGLQQARSTRTALEKSFQPQRWAVVIGIDQYADTAFSPLRFAVKDARTLGRVLEDRQHGGFDRLISLTTPELTTRDRILFELGRLRNDLKPHDTLVLYFSGHGTLEYTRDGSPHLFLVASDTRAADLTGTGIDLGDLRDFLRALRPQRKVLVLDNCFAGQGRSSHPPATRARLAAGPPPWPDLARVMSQSEAMLLASTLGGAAQEDDRLGHGTYTHFLVQALSSDRLKADANGDGAVSAYEAHDYVRARVLEHTQGTQVPEGFFRLVGRADMYLSGKPDPALERASAVVFAYGPGAQNGMQLLIDGRARGAFPRAVPVEAGARKVTIKDARGGTLADGRLRFARGQIYSVGLLMEELQGYRRFFGVNTLAALQLAGAADEVWGEVAPGVSIHSGYRVRGGKLRGLTLRFELGWAPALDGTWTDMTEQRVRHLLEAGAAAALRRSRGPLQGGIGWHLGAVYTPAVSPDSLPADGSIPAAHAHRWLSLPTGPLLWQGYALDRNLVLTLEQRLSWFMGDFVSSGSRRSNLQLTVGAGLEVGF